MGTSEAKGQGEVGNTKGTDVEERAGRETRGGHSRQSGSGTDVTGWRVRRAGHQDGHPVLVNSLSEGSLLKRREDKAQTSLRCDLQPGSSLLSLPPPPAHLWGLSSLVVLAVGQQERAQRC